MPKKRLDKLDNWQYPLDMNHFKIQSDALAIREEISQKFPEYLTLLRGIRIRVSNRTTRALGTCRSRGGVAFEIVISYAAFKHEENYSKLRDTVLHEIAHAIAGHKAGHGPAWKAIARKVGARPVRCSAALPVSPVQVVTLSCSICKGPMTATPRQAAKARRGTTYFHKRCAPRRPKITYFSVDYFKP